MPPASLLQCQPNSMSTSPQNVVLSFSKYTVTWVNDQRSLKGRIEVIITLYTYHSVKGLPLGTLSLFSQFSRSEHWPDPEIEPELQFSLDCPSLLITHPWFLFIVNITLMSCPRNPVFDYYLHGLWKLWLHFLFLVVKSSLLASSDSYHPHCSQWAQFYNNISCHQPRHCLWVRVDWPYREWPHHPQWCWCPLTRASLITLINSVSCAFPWNKSTVLSCYLASHL